MALIVQSDVGDVSGANAYISLAYFQGYCADYGYDILTFDASAQSVAIIRGSQYLDIRFEYKGYRKFNSQNTEFPRSAAYDDRGDMVIGIPEVVKKATAEYSYRKLVSGNLMPDPERDASGRIVLSKEETVGPITEKTEYYKHSVFEFPDYPLADRILISRGLVISQAKTSNTSIQMGQIGRS